MMHNKSGLSFIIPAYNEEGSVCDTIQRVKSALSNLDIPWELIVVNDGSKDRTGELVAQIDGIKIVNHPINIGYGNSLKSGIRLAQYEWIGIVDADGTYPVEDIPMLVKEMKKGFDMVIASRSNISKIDKPLKRMFRGLFKFTIRLLIKGTAEDPNSGFRLFKRDIAVSIMPFLCGTFSFTTSLTLIAIGMDYFIGHVPVQYSLRTGKSKVRHFRDSLRTAQLIIQGITFVNPIKFFLLLAVGVIILICIPAMFLTLFKMGTLSLYYMVLAATAAILIGMGVLSDIIRISANQIKQRDG